MNNQTPGPIKVDPAYPTTLCRGMSTHGELAMTFGLSQATKDAALYAAAYSAFDEAGRELGVDATVLAQTIDLVSLVRAARMAAATILEEYPMSDERHQRGADLVVILSGVPGLLTKAN